MAHMAGRGYHLGRHRIDGSVQRAYHSEEQRKAEDLEGEEALAGSNTEYSRRGVDKALATVGLGGPI